MATCGPLGRCWVTEAVPHLISSSFGPWNIPCRKRWRTRLLARRTGPASCPYQGLFRYLPNLASVGPVPGQPLLESQNPRELKSISEEQYPFLATSAYQRKSPRELGKLQLCSFRRRSRLAFAGSAIEC